MPKQKHDGPFWVFAKYDKDWDLIAVTAEQDLGEEVTEYWWGRKMRMRDQPIDASEIGLEVRRIRRALSSRPKRVLIRQSAGGVDVRFSNAVHVDRLPPNPANRPVEM